VTLFTHDGEEWLAIVTGWSAVAGEFCLGLLFEAQKTEREVFGRLRGIPPEQFGQATADQLRLALIAALSGDDD
jgi:hypothetical protein